MAANRQQLDTNLWQLDRGQLGRFSTPGLYPKQPPSPHLHWLPHLCHWFFHISVQTAGVPSQMTLLGRPGPVDCRLSQRCLGEGGMGKERCRPCLRWSVIKGRAGGVQWCFYWGMCLYSVTVSRGGTERTVGQDCLLHRTSILCPTNLKPDCVSVALVPVHLGGVGAGGKPKETGLHSVPGFY